MKKDVTFIIFGATGDLTEKKLIPAIYHLYKKKEIEKFCIIGVARREIDKMLILDSAKKYIDNLDEKIWSEIIERFFYYKINFDNPFEYKGLKEFVENIEKEKQIKGEKIFYLATLPEHFLPITRNIAQFKIDNSNFESKVMYEKPFGHDLKSAKKLNKNVGEAFREDQIYRVDHYLGKELIGNIALLRFTNRILEPLWNNKNIESVQIIFDENFGIEGRGAYYDKYGVTKDVIQNHALQVLALLAMESPKMLTGEYIREKKAEVLKKVKCKDVLLGQFRGYKNEEGVSKDSITETFFTAKFEINNKRWRGVPFFIRAGKNLNRKESVIHIKFKDVDCLLSKNCPTDSNYLSIRIQPNEGFTFEINSKAIGENFEIEPIKMDYCHKCVHEGNTPEAYEILFKHAIEGEKSLFVRNDEIELSWKIIDNIKKNKYDVYEYDVGSEGPKELNDWNNKNKIRWKK